MPPVFEEDSLLFPCSMSRRALAAGYTSVYACPHMRRLFLFPSLILTLFSMQLFARVPAEIMLPTTQAGAVAEFTLPIENPGADRARYSFLSTCSCLTPERSELSLAPGESGSLRFRLDTSGLEGEVVRMLIYTRVGGEEGKGEKGESREQGRVVVSIEVSADADPIREEESLPRDRTEPEGIPVDFYADKSCGECKAFLEEEYPRIRAASPEPLHLREHDILDPEVMEELLRRLEQMNLPLEEFPLLIVQGTALQGLEEIEEKLPPVLAGAETSEELVHRTGEEEIDHLRNLSTLTVLLAGLADGVNPCAFSTILFLLSMLALVGRSRGQILLIGTLFTVTIFIGYLAAGLGLFAVVRTLFLFPLLVQGLRWILIAMLLLLALLSFRDAWLASRGRSSEMSLQLSKEMKRRIHGVVRTRVRTGSLVFGTVVLGLLVTVFEFSCTGQVYLPVIMHLARYEADLTAYLLLAAYNLAFIIPLILVFAVAYAGIALPRISQYFAKRVALVKLALAGVFISMALLTLLT